MGDVIRIERETTANDPNKREVVIEAKKPGVDAGLFNPNAVTIAKTVNWTESGGRRRDHPRLAFEGGAARTLTLSLFFDTYEAGTDVRDHTRKVAALTHFQGSLHRPPVCWVFWGPTAAGAHDLPFCGVVTSLTQKFTLFLANGTPVRATLDLTFKEYDAPNRQELRSLPESPDRRKTRTVKRGDTLWAIAAREYDDPALWRPIADANRIANPRDLVPGTEIILPALE